MSVIKSDPIIVMRGAGDLATGVALRLFRAGLTRIVMLEVPFPLAVRRTVAFSEAVHQGKTSVESITAVHIEHAMDAEKAWHKHHIPILIDPNSETLSALTPDVLVDAIIAKKNTGTKITDAPMTIALGPGFTAGQDVHAVIETKRGHHLGRVIRQGQAAPNTGIPGNVGGQTINRVYWAAHEGIFTTPYDIGDMIDEKECLGMVGSTPVYAAISGVIRGLLRDGTPVSTRTKLGDIDPRGNSSYCNEVSDKALAVGGGVLEAVVAHLFSR